jgi:hypothetical protein
MKKVVVSILAASFVVAAASFAAENIRPTKKDARKSDKNRPSRLSR